MANVKVGLGLDRNQSEGIHIGDNVAVCKISLSVSWSSGDVHLIGKLPNGAIPLDAVFFPGGAHAAGFVAKFGTSASQELFFASATYSVATRTSRALGTATTSVGHVGDLVVYYKLPGQQV
jgi:hypothetical protein